jgi:hypothetical protein
MFRRYSQHQKKSPDSISMKASRIMITAEESGGEEKEWRTIPPATWGFRSQG